MNELLSIYSAIMHAAYFKDLGMKNTLYDENKETFNKDLITTAIENAIDKYREKYSGLKWDHSRISYKSLYEFGISFSERMANLNLETKR